MRNLTSEGYGSMPANRTNLRQFGPRLRCWLTVILIAVAVLAWGCRQNTPNPSRDETTNAAGDDGAPRDSGSAKKNTADRSGQGTPVSSADDQSASLPVDEVPKAVIPEGPVEPGSCLTSGCHLNLKQRTVQHATFLLGDCYTCHQKEQPGHKFPLVRTGATLCTNCHDRIGHKTYVHGVISNEGCTPCHDPHSSAAKYLLTSLSIEITCNSCHPLTRNKVRHAPFAAGQCTSCHDPHEAENPNLLVGGDGADHCYVCHGSLRDRVKNAEIVHAPLQSERGCETCHESHSSDHAALLRGPVDQICYQCHADIKVASEDKHNQHGALLTGKRCANCHETHAGGRAGLLKDVQLTLCLNCHNKPVEAYDGHTIPNMEPILTDREFLHGPVREGQCDACHNVHGSINDSLLSNAFPSQFYEAFNFTNYALCFQCHNGGIVLEEETTTLTNFRDKDRNLHFVHVNRRKGRTCRTCHEMHGSNLPNHMAAEVPFDGGGWSMPIRYERVDGGGRCSPGCHEPMEYRRGPIAETP